MLVLQVQSQYILYKRKLFLRLCTIYSKKWLNNHTWASALSFMQLKKLFHISLLIQLGVIVYYKLQSLWFSTHLIMRIYFGFVEMCGWNLLCNASVFHAAHFRSSSRLYGVYSLKKSKRQCVDCLCRKSGSICTRIFMRVDIRHENVRRYEYCRISDINTS